MRMKAAILREQGRPRPYARSIALSIEEVDLLPPGPGELLIEVAAAGLCHSDLSAIEGIRPRPLPVIIGHEGAGIVREVGAGGSDLAPGDHVITVFAASCGTCRYCVNGRPNLCPAGNAARAAGTLRAGTRRLFQDGKPINHGSGLSLFAQFAVIDRRSAVKIDQDIPLDDAAIFGCAVMTGAGAVINTAGLKAGEHIGIVGLGGVGMNALFAAVSAGAGRIVAVDASAEKLALARQWGATDTFLATDPDCAEQVREATGGGLDKVVEAAGAMKAVELAYAITGHGGCLVCPACPTASSASPICMPTSSAASAKSAAATWAVASPNATSLACSASTAAASSRSTASKVAICRSRTSTPASTASPMARSCARYCGRTDKVPYPSIKVRTWSAADAARASRS